MPRNMTEGALNKARYARKQPSIAEKKMWQRLRNGKIGFKFRREHPMGPYRLDFFCFEAMLAIEMDGEQHDPARDSVRDQYMLEAGILTYRISNLAFFDLNDQPFVDEIENIVLLCEERSGRKAFDNTHRA